MYVYVYVYLYTPTHTHTHIHTYIHIHIVSKIQWLQIGKGVYQGCILSPCLFNLYIEYIMRNSQLDEAQARIRLAGRYINNLR